MQVMVELSLYPLVNEYIPPIQNFIDRLNSYTELSINTCSTSTQVTGDYKKVMTILGKEMQRTHEEVGQAIFVAKRSAIEMVVEKHELLQNLLGNGWLHLIAIEDSIGYRLARDGSWQELLVGTEELATA